ncbi:MAG: enoyl-CoA hydratase-related protein [Gammaproteobacteria bacterium]|nr:enoyl-CoA hydratase-related protein [Gammaproteobacteria bacterium]
MELKSTRYDVADGIATLTLHRPERMNAWTGRMHTEYRWMVQQAEDDPAVRALIVTGSGRAFCAGADTKALEGHVSKGGYDPGTPDDLAEPGYGVRPEFDAFFAWHFGLTKPVIAAINGPAAGVGFALACYADLRFAAEGAKFTTAHGRLNLPAEYGLSWLLPKLVGLTRANDILLTSRKFLAEEAAAMGLVNASAARRPADGSRPRLRCRHDRRQFPRLAGVHSPPDLFGPAPLGGRVGDRLGGEAGADDEGARFCRGCGGAGGEAIASLGLSAGTGAAGGRVDSASAHGWPGEGALGDTRRLPGRPDPGAEGESSCRRRDRPGKPSSVSRNGWRQDACRCGPASARRRMPRRP